MKNLRLKTMLFLYDFSSKLYAKLFKFNQEPWGLTKEDLNQFPVGSLGKEMANFYYSNGFDVMPKLENHDVFHIITNTGTEIQDEIAMQYLLFGNGKVSLYLLAMIFIGTTLYPEYLSYFRANYYKGKSFARFYDVEYKDLLNENLIFLQDKISLQKLPRPII